VAVAWPGREALCQAGKTQQQVTTAVARELVGFIWAVACEVMSKAHGGRSTSAS
jgi:hypothetical protein